MTEEKWFREIYNAYFKSIYRLVANRLYTYTGSSADAQDIVQEVFLLAAQKDIHHHPNPGGWLMVTANHICMNHCKSSARHKKKLDCSADHLPDANMQNLQSAPDETEDTDTRLTLKMLLSAEDYRILSQHYIHGRSLADIAGDMGISYVAVRVRIHRIRSRLKEIFCEL